MSDSAFSRAVGFVLAIAFAIVMGICIGASLIPTEPTARIMTDQERHQMLMAGLAGGIGALLAWMIQKYAASRGFIIRFIYALFVYALVFVALGGLFQAAYDYSTKTGLDWSVSGVYGATMNQFYSFALNLVMSPPLALGPLLFAAGLYLAIFGPRRRER